MYYSDYHIHTCFSDDSNYPMSNVVLDAIKKGINEICFTDHIDYGVSENINVSKYVKEISKLKNKYRKDIIIRTGMEFGVQRQTINKYNKLYNLHPFDFILLSVHEIDNKEFWDQAYQKNLTQEQYNIGYYEELLHIIKNYNNYSVLAHLDVIVRYDINGYFPFEKTKKLVKEILDVVIKNDKGIEVNTSNYRYKLKNTTPSMEILKMYYQMGGKIITFGSDCHKPENLGEYILKAQNLLRNIGFKEFATFENMNPIMHKL